jgi:hypothetical protein
VQVVEVPEDALVIRFSPWTAEKVLERAGKAARHRGDWTASVFAGVKISPDEADGDLYRRLLAAADLHHLSGNDKFAVCARAGDLLDLGFVFTKDGDDDEADEHYSVLLGHSPTLEDVTRFLSAFTTREKRPQ